jgi:hypothetical protein
MGFSRADIRKAQENFYLREASKQLGRDVKSLDEVRIVKPTSKDKRSLGKRLTDINNKNKKNFGAYF